MAKVRPLRIVALAGALALVLGACGSLVVDEDDFQALGAQEGGAAGVAGQAVPGQAGGLPAGGQAASSPGAVPGAPGGGAVAGAQGPSLPQGCSGGASDIGVTATTIKVGQIVSITGPLPGAFDSAVDAVDAYLKLVNERGICGRRFQLIVEDDGFDATTSRIKAEKLAREDKVFAFVGSTGADAGMDSVVRKNKIPDVGFPLSWSRAASPYTYGVPGKTNRRTTPEGKYASEYLNKLNGIKQIAIFFIRDSETSFVNAWSGEAGMLKTSGGQIEICHEQGASALDVNFNQYVLSMQGNCNPANGPIAVYSTMENNANIRLARAMRDQAFQFKHFAPTSTSYHPSFIQDAEGATEGAYVGVPIIPFERYPNHPELKLYLDNVRRHHPRGQPAAFGAYAWGQAAVFVQAVASCGAKLTRVCVNRYLTALGPFSANGFIAPTRPSDNFLFTCNLIMQVRGGRFVEVQAPAGAKGPAGGADFWNCSGLFDWFQYYCTHKDQFPTNSQRDSFVRQFVKDCG